MPRFDAAPLAGSFTLLIVGTLVAGCGLLLPQGGDGGDTETDGGSPEDAPLICDGANLSTDNDNCGNCGVVCETGFTCIDGLCTPPGFDAQSLVCDNIQFGCGPEEICCVGQCYDPTTNANNCGGCDIQCAPGQACVDSKCGGCYQGETCTGTQQCCALTQGCSDVQTDPRNCGACGWQCPIGDTCVDGQCATPCNDGGACANGQTCCASGCIDTLTDTANCGACGVACGAGATCLDGTCASSEGAFNPTVNPTYLTPGGHYFTTIDIPAGVTVYVAGSGTQSGTLDLHASGAVEIDGTIDLSGGPGTQNTVLSLTDGIGTAGGGGFTGEPYASGAPSAACTTVSGTSGSLGISVAASPGDCPVAPVTSCPVAPNVVKGSFRPDTTLPPTKDQEETLFTAAPATFGGGAGIFTGFRAYGSGGGGVAGGAPGALGSVLNFVYDCSGVQGGGGAMAGAGGSAGGAPYDGAAGVLGTTQCGGDYPLASIGGGGGGSIGPTAATDLAVTSSFQTGSAGGGGSADYSDRPFFGGTSGGGGAGGAIKIETAGTLTITGRVLANGGPGADAYLGAPAASFDGCDPQPGAGGGGGSGGVVFLSAPSISIAASAMISAAGGAGGAASAYATGGDGGAGGLGRIRMSVGSACSLNGTFQPPLVNGCTATAPNGTSGHAYIGVYPN